MWFHVIENPKVYIWFNKNDPVEFKEITLIVGARPAQCFTGGILLHHTSEDLDAYVHFMGEETKAQRLK